MLPNKKCLMLWNIIPIWANNIQFLLISNVKMLKDRYSPTHLNELLVLALWHCSVSASQRLSSHSLVRFFSLLKPARVVVAVSEETGFSENLCSLYMCVCYQQREDECLEEYHTLWFCTLSGLLWSSDVCLTVYDTVMGVVLNILTYVTVLVSGSEVFWPLCFFFFLESILTSNVRGLFLSLLILKCFFFII